ncbi:MAG: protein-glutamate methylesterase/protein-glutamine glutaminase [Limnochordia bacterium]
MEKIKVLIIDDSALVRQLLEGMINSHPQMEVVGTAADPYFAVEKIKENKPHVITLDVEMPRMNGLEFLQRLMASHPIPVVMISSWTESNSEIALKALEYGAVDVVAKPKVGIASGLRELKIQILDKIEAAARVDVRRLRPLLPTRPAQGEKSVVMETTAKVIVIGASTGGTRAVTQMVSKLGPATPGMVVVQHMPQGFTKSFAQSLDRVSTMKVKEAQDGDRILKGHVLVAPGDYHTEIARSGSFYHVRIHRGPLVNRHRPSVGLAFLSAARDVGRNAVGIILTGMGDDGARELGEIRRQGGMTIAQDEASSVVFGMPRRAIELGSAQRVMSLDEITEYLRGLA